MWGAAPTRRAFKVPIAAFLTATATAAALGVAAGSADASPLRALHISPKGSNSSLCTLRRPCRTFARAYRLARPGQTVLVRGGTYGGQTLPYDWKKLSSRKVVFRPAGTARVTIRGSLRVSARYVELRGFKVGSWVASAPAGHVVFRSVSAGRFVVSGASDVSVLGGTLGPSANLPNLVQAKSSTSVHPPRNLLVSGVTVTGYRSTTGAPTHCLEVRNAIGLTVRNSRFLDCDGSAVYFAEGGFAGAPANVTLENDVFGRTGSYAVYLAGARGERWANFLVRNNSSDRAIAVSPQSRPAGGLDFYSNIATSFTGCGRAGVSADFNVWRVGSACGAGDVVAPAGFVNPAGGNYDLLPGSAAIDLSPLGKFSSTDLSGTSRPIGGGGDAGAYESNSSGLVAAFALNESAGSLARDASSLGNAGTVSGASWTTSGRYGGALSFDGENDWVTVADAASLDLTGSLTLEAWVKADANGSVWRTVLMKEQLGGLTYGLYSDTNTGKPSGNVNVGAELDARAASELPLNAWTHLAVTYDGSALKLFMNGKEVGSRAVSGSLATSAGALRLGGNGVWDEWFDGVIDEVRVYSRPLTAKQVRKDMTSAIRVQADTEAPAAPASLSTTDATTTSISVAWPPAADDVGVAGYGLYRNGSLAGSASGLTYTFTGLACGTTYTLAVDTYDAAGNRSAKTTTTAATAACPPPDTEAPSVPTGLNASGATATTVFLGWTASTDDVGVTGYELFRNGTSAGTTAGLSFTFSSLACETSYTFEVRAFDAAGNRSGKASLAASTSACPIPGTADLYVSGGGSDSNACTQAAPCRSLDRAYEAASPGDVVQVAGGSYPDQTVNATPKSSGPDVVFQPAAGSVATFGDIDVTSGSHIEFRDFTVTRETYNRPGAQWITYQRVKMRQFFIRGADHISYVDTEAGPNVSDDGMNWITAAYQTNDGASDILLDGFDIHDFKKWNAGAHVDCIGIDDVDGLTIRNTRIWNCEHFSLIFGKDLWSARASRNVLIENSFLDCCYSGYYSIGLGDVEGPMTIRFNSTTLGFGWLGGSVKNVTIDSNVIANNSSANCASAVWRYNVVASGSSCGGTLAASGFRAPPSDLHLLLGAAAIDAGNPTSYPAADIDGQMRPSGSRPDAGADEVG